MSWAITGIVVGVIGAGVGAYSGIQAAKQAEAVGDYNAKVAENQALQAEMDAHESIRRKRQENLRFMSAQRARIAKSGVLEEGTPLEIMADTAGTLELATLDFSRSQAQQQASMRAQGAYAKYEGNAQATGYRIGAGATLLSGVGSSMGTFAASRK